MTKYYVTVMFVKNNLEIEFSIAQENKNIV